MAEHRPHRRRAISHHRQIGPLQEHPEAATGVGTQETSLCGAVGGPGRRYGSVVHQRPEPTALVGALDRLGVPDTAAVHNGLSLSLARSGSMSAAPLRRSPGCLGHLRRPCGGSCGLDEGGERPMRDPGPARPASLSTSTMPRKASLGGHRDFANQTRRDSSAKPGLAGRILGRHR